VITMLEKLGFQSLVEQTLSSKRIPRAMDLPVRRVVGGPLLVLHVRLHSRWTPTEEKEVSRVG
jgi:hypothetical protein